MSEPKFDVIAVEIATGKERFMAQDQPRRDAEAIMRMAVIRRGVEEEFFAVRPHPHTLRTEASR